MGSVSADVAALRDLADTLDRAGSDIAALTDPNKAAGRVVLDATRPPRRSGALAASLRADATPNGVTFASTARYWTFVHYGAPRRHIKARPFFTEALTATTADVVQVYARHAADVIREV